MDRRLLLLVAGICTILVVLVPLIIFEPKSEEKPTPLPPAVAPLGNEENPVEVNGMTFSAT
ncbi:MAG: hypothetical protein ACFFED_17020 [Candidatus Thorarchaeota archaeon]